ncbi:hypothetical protein ACLOJK_018597 [Asimina triloba]
MYRAVLQLNEMHGLYEKLLWDAEQQLLKVYDSAVTGEGRDLGVHFANPISEQKSKTLQFGGDIEDIRFYSTPLLPSSQFSSCLSPVASPIQKTNQPLMPTRHVSSIGKFWIWGKGDGGHLGLGHENSVFVPTENHNIDGLRSIALGGIHSAALTTHGNVFTSRSSSSIPPSHLKGLSRAFS